ncbi:MAG: outer membrane protein assembly factor BamD [Bacteroidales bacterium]|nr:outer membrane protein assembly factor BamD [Bacteroidales bacterium]
MRHKLTVTALAALLLAACFSSCKSQFEMLLNSSDVRTKYDAAFEYFNNGKYSKAADLFESLSVQTPGMAMDDTVQYYWGLSNYKFKDYYTAETNFLKFTENYPASPFTGEAKFLRIDCLFRQTLRYELDQAPTYKALTAIGEYIAAYPTSEHVGECKDMIKELQLRLDTKAYEAAKLYYKMEDYKASRVAFRNVLKDNAENAFREDILYYTAMSSYKYAKLSVPAKQKERYLVFIDDYLNFVGELPDSPYCKELENLYKKAQKAIGRGVEDTGDDMKEKDFARERKKLLKEEGKK